MVNPKKNLNHELYNIFDSGKRRVFVLDKKILVGIIMKKPFMIRKTSPDIYILLCIDYFDLVIVFKINWLI